MSGITPDAAYGLDRDYLGNPGLLSPPHSSGVPTPGPGQMFSPGGHGSGDAQGRIGGNRAPSDLPSSASSVMSSLAHLQGRYMSQSLGLAAQAPGDYNQLMTHYLSQYGAGGAGSSTGVPSVIPDHLKGPLPPVSQYWPTQSSSQSSFSEGYAAHLYGLGAPPSLYAPYLSVMQQEGATPGPERLHDAPRSTNMFYPGPPMVGTTSLTRSDSLHRGYDGHQDSLLRTSLDPLCLSHHAAVVSPGSRSNSLHLDPSGSSLGFLSSSAADNEVGSGPSTTPSLGTPVNGTNHKSSKSLSTSKSSGHSSAVSCAGGSDVRQTRIPDDNQGSQGKSKSSSKSTPYDCLNGEQMTDSSLRSRSHRSSSSCNSVDAPSAYRPATLPSPKCQSKTSKSTKVSPSHKSSKSVSMKSSPTNNSVSCSSSRYGSVPQSGKSKSVGTHGNVLNDPKDKKTGPRRLTSDPGENVTTLHEVQLHANSSVDKGMDLAKKMNKHDKKGKEAIITGCDKKPEKSRVARPQSPGAVVADVNVIDTDQKTLINKQRHANDTIPCKNEGVVRDGRFSQSGNDRMENGIKCLTLVGERQAAESNLGQIEIKSEKNELVNYIRGKGLVDDKVCRNGDFTFNRHNEQNTANHVHNSNYENLVLKQSPPSVDTADARRPDKFESQPVALTSAQISSSTQPFTDQNDGDHKTLLFPAQKQEPMSPSNTKAGNKRSESSCLQGSRVGDGLLATGIDSGKVSAATNGVCVKTETTKASITVVKDNNVTVAAGNFSGNIQYSVSRCGDQAVTQPGVRKVHATTFTPEIGTLPSVTCLTDNRPLTSVADTNNNNSNSSTYTDNSSQSSTDSLYKKEPSDGGDVAGGDPSRCMFSSLTHQVPGNCKVSPSKSNKCRQQATKLSPSGQFSLAQAEDQSAKYVSPTKQTKAASQRDPPDLRASRTALCMAKREDGVSVKAEESLSLTTNATEVSSSVAQISSKSYPLDLGSASNECSTSAVRAVSPCSGYLDKGDNKEATITLKKESKSPESPADGHKDDSPRLRPERPDRPLPISHVKTKVEVEVKPENDANLHTVTQPVSALGTAGYPWQAASAMDPYGNLLHAAPPPPLFPHFISPQYPMPMDPRYLQMYSDKQRQSWLESAGYMFPPALAAPQYPQGPHLAHSQHILGMGHPDYRDGYPEPRFGGGMPCPAALSERRTSHASTVSIDVDDSGSAAGLVSSRDNSRERGASSRDHSKERGNSAVCTSTTKDQSKERRNSMLTSRDHSKERRNSVVSSRDHSKDSGCTSREQSRERINVTSASSREHSKERQGSGVIPRDYDRERTDATRTSQDVSPKRDHKTLKRSASGKIKTESHVLEQRTIECPQVLFPVDSVHTKIEKEEKVSPCPEARACNNKTDTTTNMAANELKSVDCCQSSSVKDKPLASSVSLATTKALVKSCDNHLERSCQGLDMSNASSSTTNSANIPVGIAYARQRTATQSDVRESPLGQILDEGQRLLGADLPSHIAGIVSDVRTSVSGTSNDDSITPGNSDIVLEGRSGEDLDTQRFQQAPTIPGYTQANNTPGPQSLQPIPIPPGYKLVQDKTNGQMFLLPDPTLLGVSQQPAGTEASVQPGKNIFDQIFKSRHDLETPECISRMSTTVNVAQVSMPKQPISNGPGHSIGYTSPWLPQNKVLSKDQAKDKAEVKFPKIKDDVVESTGKSRPGSRVQRPIGAVATVVRHERTKQAATVKPQTVTSQSRTAHQTVEESSGSIDRSTSVVANSTYPPPSEISTGVTDRFVTVTAGSKITTSTLTQTSSDVQNLPSSEGSHSSVNLNSEADPVVSCEARSCSPVGFADDVPLKYLIPRKLVSTATGTEEHKLKSVHVQTEEYNISVNIPSTSYARRTVTKDCSVQTPNPEMTNRGQNPDSDHRVSTFQQRTSDLLRAASSLNSPDLLPKSEAEACLLDDGTHRNTPPVLTRMVDLSASSVHTASMPAPSTFAVEQQGLPGSQQQGSALTSASQLPSASRGSDAWQVTDGLQLLGILAEQIQQNSKKAQLLSVVEERSVSPDINKNYNAPKSYYFETEDFAQSTARFLKKDDDDGFQPQWTSNLFKVTTEPDNMDAMELDYRVRLAEIQRKYKEKQKELAKLHPKKSDDRQYRRRNVGRPKKRSSCKSSRSDTQSRSEKVPTPEPDEGFEASPRKKQRSASKDTKESQAISSSKGNQVHRSKSVSKTPVKHKSVSESKSSAKKTNNNVLVSEKNGAPGHHTTTTCSTAPSAVPEVLLLSSEYYSSTEVDSDTSSSSQQDHSGDTTSDNDHDDHYQAKTGLGLLAQYATSQVRPSTPRSPGDPTNPTLKSKRKRKSGDEGGSSKKKRKPGRPKKIDEQIMTETIVAKKPKNFSFYSYGNSKGYGSAFKKSISKNGFTSKSAVASKIKQPESRSSCDIADWNRRRSERIFISESRQSAKTSTSSDHGTDKIAENKNLNTQGPGGTTKSTLPKVNSPSLKSKTSKDRSKSQGGHDLPLSVKTSHTTNDGCDADAAKSPSKKEVVSCVESSMAPRLPSFSFSLSSVGDSDSDTDTSSDGDVPLSTLKERATTPEPRMSKMTKDDLKHGLSVLLFQEGLFYESTVRAIEPPDIYGVIIRGERGSKAHIIPQEELLQQAVLDVSPGSARYLREGTRVCAYWSQQFSCLYPGTVSKESPNPQADSNLISVEFDDGDSGRIPVEHIRMLPADFPLQDLEMNQQVLGSCKKRRTMSDDLLVVECKERKPFHSEALYQISQDIWNQKKAQAKLQKVGEGPSERNAEECQKEAPKTTKVVPKTLLKMGHAAVEKSRFDDSEKPAKCQSRSYSSPAKVMNKDLDRSTPVRKDKKLKESQEIDDCDDSDSSNGDDSMATSSQSGDSDSYSDTEEDEEYVPGRHGSQKPQLIGKNKRVSEKSDGKSSSKAESVRHEAVSDAKDFLSAQELWQWVGKGTKRPGMKGRAKREYFKAIQRGKEVINVGDSAVFLSAGRTLPYVGRIVSLWQGWGGNMVVKVKWFYHPEETKGGKKLAEIRGALYQSPHVDENDVQTISHKCQLMSYVEWKGYRGKRRRECQLRGVACDWDDDVYYLAGTYDPTIGMITFQPDVKLL